MREFGFSGTFIREGRRRILVLILFLTAFLLAFALYYSDFRIERALVAVGICLLILGVIMAIEIPLINRRLRKLRVLIYEDKLVRQCGKRQRVILWKDIARIKTVKKKDGVVAQIKLYPKKPQMWIYLYGYNEMEDLANLIKERTSDRVLLQEKHWKLDWQNPFVGVLTGGVPAMVVMFIIGSMGSKAIDIFAIVCALSVGLCLLMFKPMAKLDVCNKWVESLLGVVLLLLGIYGLICFLLTGRIP
ncbi:MAG: hypothetical protein ACYSWW_12990 [Planctomycetota bacterium]|jgi:protein-S-isoprenylcysteine O-methyltransferase Ste14